jgi:serine/threonine protein phosphatase PrpC
MISHLFGMKEEPHRPGTLPPSRDPEAQLLRIWARLDALELACSGLWDLLREKHGYSDQEIADNIRRVDLADGVIDGASKACPICGERLLARNRHRCLWCGAELPTGVSLL